MTNKFVEWPAQHLKCHYHKDQKIQNFCICNSCLLPLCPKCIKTHTDQHCEQNTCSSIETFLQTVNRALQQIEQDLTLLKNKFNEIKEYNLNKYISIIKVQIGKAKQEALQQLESYFTKVQAALINDTKTRIQQLHLTEKGQLNDVLLKQIQAIQRLYDGISNKHSISDLIRYLGSQIHCNVLNLADDIQYKIQTFEANHLKLKVHKVRFFDSLNNSVEIIYPFPLEQVMLDKTASHTNTINFQSAQPLTKCDCKILKPRHSRCSCKQQNQFNQIPQPLYSQRKRHSVFGYY